MYKKKQMKNKLFLLGMAGVLLTFGLSMVSCATEDGGRYAPDSPAEQDCTLIFKGSAFPNLANTKIACITAFDGT